jgi:hypothetical protein
MSLSKSKCWYSNNCLHFLKLGLISLIVFSLLNDAKVLSIMAHSRMTLGIVGKIVTVIFMLIRDA